MSPGPDDTGFPGPLTLSERGQLTESEARQVGDLIDEVADADGVSPVNEHVLLHLRHGGDVDSSNFLLTTVDGSLVGYGHLDPTDPIAGPAAELAIHPAHRGRGLGRRLLTA
ncbi:MAG: GNAT family N-acetyltransferase, partial [Actinomycetota bacterium]|nr:GNAT family N-acetyltransferase [Actinomycetota bacterium]